MKIYSDNGYLNMRGIAQEGYPFTFIVSARGWGKTYGALDDVKENDIRFMYMRRTQTQIDLCMVDDFSPFKTLNQDKGWNVRLKKVSKYNSMFYSELSEGIKLHGFACALSTVSNLRGFDASDIERIIYDEFIPEKHEKPIKNEADALWNAYETMNRNRELQGKKPIQLICLANSNELGNPIFESLGLINIADKMNKSGNECYRDDNRGILLIMPARSAIGEKKRNTALYRLTKGTGFSEMALDNSFRVNRQHITPRPIIEYNPVCIIGELCIYRHKSKRAWYATTYKTGFFKNIYTTSDADILNYRRVFGVHWDLYIEDKIDFEDVLAEKLFLKYWDE